MLKKIIELLKNKEITWVAVGSALNFILQFIMIKVLTATGQESYGFYVLVVSIVAFLNSIYFGPFEQSFNRYYHNLKSGERAKEFLSFFFGFNKFNILYLGAFTLLLAGLSIPIFSNYSGILIFTSAIFIYGSLIKTLPATMLNNVRARKEYYLSTIFYYILSIAAFYIFSKASGTKDLSVFMFFGALASILITFITLSSLYKNYLKAEKIEFFPLISKFKDLIAFAYPFMIFGVTGWLQSYGERWFIYGNLSLKEVGVYGLMASIANAGTSFIYNFTATYFAPLLFDKSSDKNGPHKAKKLFIYYYLVTSALFALFLLFVLIFGKKIILILSGPEFASSSSLLVLITMGYTLFFAGQTVTLRGMAANNSGIYILPKVIPGLLMLISGYLGSKYYGMPGVAITLIIVNLLYFLLTILANRKLNKAI